MAVIKTRNGQLMVNPRLGKREIMFIFELQALGLKINKKSLEFPDNEDYMKWNIDTKSKNKLDEKVVRKVAFTYGFIPTNNGKGKTKYNFYYFIRRETFNKDKNFKRRMN